MTGAKADFTSHRISESHKQLEILHLALHQQRPNTYQASPLAGFLHLSSQDIVDQ
jgi:hypothetical protein